MDQPFSQASVGLKHPQLRNEIEVAIEKFTSLRSICNPPHIHDDPTFSEKALLQISMEETSFKGELMWALECRYLPTLQHQLTTLLRSLDPSGLQKEAESQLQLVSETQSGLERSISFINIAIAIACPEPIPPLHPVDDQHRQLLKTYSLSSLKSKYLAATHFASSLFAEANELLEQLKLSPDEFNGKTDTPSMQEKSFKSAVGLIEQATQPIHGSELDIIQNDWNHNVKSLNYSLEEFERLVKVEGHMMPCGTHDETRKELVKLAIPISKLIKLFFSKLSRRGMNRKQLPLFTDMCSEQIDSFAGSAGQVALDMLLFQILFTRAHMAARPATSQDFIQILHELKEHLVTPLLVVLLHLIPLIPDTDDPHSQNYYRSCFSTWNTHLVLAIGNFTTLAKSLDDDPL
ncbi:hypothetical protein Pst134EA_008983 [Puccinia striiformis f. sp. tritici]|uniref:hypothetical protein n=1 Tax=Puccinia striiformis f. sp. tritici TaxID=168172 RepID=UPI002007438D|nr:hypothetical protein Pst134EA_008983 [Puccinia striiformis f. sp. tritici]KAH9468439.1 hypothetical protein Pst134EA_008983 [Puccinia striiformis f. sp. tritici]